GRNGCRSSESVIGISTGPSSMAEAIMRYSFANGPVQSRHARDDREDRLLRSRPLRKNDESDGHLRQARSQAEGKDAVAGHQNRPHTVLRPPAGGYRQGRQLQSEDAALYRPRAGLLQRDAEAGA